MEKDKLVEYIHDKLNEEVTAIGGHYVFTHETRLPFQDQEVLYLTGYSVMDTTCCGEGGCGFALVYGIIGSWKTGKNEAGRHISHLTPVCGETIQKEIRRLVMKQEVVNQVNFM